MVARTWRAPPPAAEARGVGLRGWRAWALVLVALALSVTVSVVALSTASGVTSLGDDSYDTTFVSGWWSLAWLLPVLPGVTAWWRPGVAVWQLAAIVAPQLLTAVVVMVRYQVSGWGDGLESFALLLPLGMIPLTALLIGVALLVSPRSRAARRA